MAKRHTIIIGDAVRRYRKKARLSQEALAEKSGITNLRGQWHTYRGIPLMPTYHPACLLHNQSHAEKRRVWEDLLAVMEKLGLPISEKQRGYFARG